jgi:hypothetical protein
MKRIGSALAVLLAASLPAVAEEISLKDGTKIVGHMNSLTSDKIEVVTAYGKMLVKRSDIVTISFPENNPSGAATSAPDAAAVKKDPPPVIDEALNGTQYVNRTGRFSLTLPAGWIINPDLPHSKAAIAGLSSKDKMRFLMVVQEEYTGSLESYKDLGQLQARGSFGNYEELSESPVTIDGKAGLMISYRGALAKSNLPVQFLTAIIPSGTTFTRVTTWCVEPLFHETQPTFEKIVTSYRSNGQISASAGSSKP